MNIHFQDKRLFEQLKERSFFQVEVGSKLYGIKDENSDTDILYIYLDTNPNSLISNTHHQLQYKEEGVDHIFTTLPNFIRNIQNGDSSINYEVLFSQEMANSTHSALRYLHQNRYWFRTYNVVKAYLGRAKHDLKVGKAKSIAHAYRGIIAASLILDNAYVNDFAESQHPDVNIFHKIKLKELKKGKYEEFMIQNLYDKAEDMRYRLKDMLERKSIWKNFCPLRHRDLDNEISSFLTQMQKNQETNNDSLDFSCIYDALENGISYKNNV